MLISKDKFVTMNIRIKDEDGNTIEDTFAKNQPLSYQHGAGQILPGIEEGLESKNAGDEFAFDIAPEKAFGQRFEESVQQAPKEMFAEVENLQEGMVLKSVDPTGREMLFTVKSIEADTVTIDANHPLAGKSINVSGTILNVSEQKDDQNG